MRPKMDPLIEFFSAVFRLSKLPDLFSLADQSYYFQLFSVLSNCAIMGLYPPLGTDILLEAISNAYFHTQIECQQTVERYRGTGWGQRDRLKLKIKRS